MRPGCDEVGCIGIGECQGRHLLDICAGGECLVTTRNDDSSYTLVLFIVCECLIELNEEGTRQCIECSRSVQCDCNSVSACKILPATEHILKPTPGFGLETMMFS